MRKELSPVAVLMIIAVVVAAVGWYAMYQWNHGGKEKAAHGMPTTGPRQSTADAEAKGSPPAKAPARPPARRSSEPGSRQMQMPPGAVPTSPPPGAASAGK